MSANNPLRGLKKTHKAAIAGVAALSAAALGFTLVPGGGGSAQTEPQALNNTQHVTWSYDANSPQAKALATSLKNEHGIVTYQAKLASDAKVAADLQKQAVADKAKAAAEAKATAQAAAAKRAAEQAAANRSATRAPVYANNLDGWIRESLDIMNKHDIPGTYHGIYKNVMRESSGNPMAINNWDINAVNGIPSKGLLQVIYPTFKTYHIPGTKFDQYDPVANIVAACNYAADRYGTIDNVNSAY
ncbi:phage tail length tape-measure protein [Streptomyces laurentii]|uniref:Phage tail length tape-measure protein n=1 Tax=Streptomyces laurentii TaxID=39478 RepID=A0A160NWZ9_STRLU|nr:phage tail length tape-measure protein [Streptomyces laurentii]